MLLTLDINWKTDTFVLNKELTDEWEFKSTSLLYFILFFHFCILKVIFLRERHLSQSEPLCLKLELDVFYVLHVIIPNDCHCIILSNPQIHT